MWTFTENLILLNTSQITLVCPQTSINLKKTAHTGTLARTFFKHWNMVSAAEISAFFVLMRTKNAVL